MSHDEPITSCVVEPEQQLEDEPNLPRSRLPKGGNQKIVLDALRPLFTDASIARHGRAGAPPTRPCIEMDVAIDRIASRLTVEPKRRKERARQAITGLVATQVLAINEGWIWLA